MKSKVYTLNYLFLVFLALCAGSPAAFGQLQGVYTPGSGGYATLASIISALNTQGVSGAVTVNLPAGFTETAPAGGYVIGSDVLNTGANSLNATRRLLIRKTGTGANPLLTAGTGTGNTDAVFTIAGADYITIEGVDLREHTGNTTDNSRMEWGYALLKRTTTGIGIDGCQHIAIRNCTITLDKTNRQAVGVYSGNHAAGSTTAVIPTAAAGTHRNDTVAGNTIRNITRGVSLTGYTAGAETLMDAGYVIEDNTIENFGHPVSAAGSYLTAAGIYVTGSAVSTIGKNTVSNAAGSSTPNMWGALYGIFHGPAKGGYLRVLENEVSLVQDSTVNQTAVYGIRSEIGAAVTSGGNPQDENKLIISGNTISARGSRAGGGQFQLISHTGAIRDLNISENIFRDIHFNGLGNCFFINNAMNSSPDASVIVIRHNRLNGAFRVNGLGSSAGFPGQVIFINNAGDINGNILKDTIEGNDFSNFDVSDGNPLNVQIVIGVQDAIGGTAAPFAPKYISGNRFMNMAGVQFRGFNISKTGVNATDTARISHNTISKVHGLNYGIQINTADGIIANIHDNRIDSSHNTGMNMTQTRGIDIYGGAYFNIYNNRIAHLTVSHATSTPAVYGIHIRNGVQVNVYNNMVGFLGAPASPNLPDFNLAGIYAERGDTIRLFHNTLYLAPADPAKDDYAISGILYTEISDEVDIRNNIVHVASRPVRGITSAIRRKTGDPQVMPFNLASTMNGNILFALDIPRSYLYAEHDSANLVNAFTATDFNLLCGPYKSFMAPRESGSFYEDNLSVDANGYYAPSGSSYAKERGVPTTPAVTHDIAGVSRPVQPDAGALQFTGTAIPVGGHLSVTLSGPAGFCQGDSVMLSVSPGDAVALIWQRDGNDIATATDSSYTAKETGMYRVVFSYTSGCADTSESVSVVVHPAPQPVITASGSNGEILSTGSYTDYQWQIDGNNIPGAQSMTYTAVASGNYTVTVTDANGCVGTSAVQTVDLEAGMVGDGSPELRLRLYPNPAGDVLYWNDVRPLRVEIAAPDGKAVLHGVFSGSADVSMLPAGIYIVRMIREDGTSSAQEKVIILR